MPKFESLELTPENVSLTQAEIFMLNEASYDRHQVAKDIGVFVAAHTDKRAAYEIIGVLADTAQPPLDNPTGFILAASNGASMQIRMQALETKA